MTRSRKIPLGLLALLALPALFLVSSLGRDRAEGPAPAGAETGPERAGPAPAEHHERIARLVADGLPRAHVTHRDLDDTIADQAFETYLETLDHDRSVFLASDVEEFEQWRESLDEQLRRGHTQFAFKVFDRFIQRMRERVEFVNRLLESEFDFSLDEEFRRDREGAPWPATPEEQNELWRKKIKNEFLAHRVNRTLKEEEAAAATNRAAGADSDAGEEDGEQVEDGGETALDRSPEEAVRDRYRQFLSVLEGHDAQWVLQMYLNGFTRAYDAHSSYMSPRASEDFDIAMRLSLTGIGALLTMEEGAAKIVRLIPGGPAEQDGRLKPGDKIIAVGQEGEEPVDILYWPLYKSVRLIRGPVGTEVRLEVVPASDSTGTQVKTIVLTRDEIKLEEKAAKSRVRDVPGRLEPDAVRLGVIELPDFYADLRGRRNGDEEPRSCSRDVQRLLESLQTNRVDGLLLDLRNNGGGSLPDAIEMSGFFIDDGPIVQVKANRRIRVLRDPRTGVLFEKPMLVLVNRQSASASEILAGALQDYGRALIVGDEKTHGKGTVQSVFPLDRKNPKLGALKITTAAFFRIDGRSTQLKGVAPDIVLPSPLEAMEVGEEYLDNVLPWSRIEAAAYEPVGTLGGVANRLKALSENRLATNQSYATYQDLLHRLESRVKMTNITLNLEKRLAMGREDREIEELQQQLEEQFSRRFPDRDDEEDDKTDLVLEESLQILRDMVEMQRDPDSTMARRE